MVAPTAFQLANEANARESARLSKLIRNLQNIQNVTNNWTAANWSEIANANNVNRLQALYEARKRNPAAYNFAKLIRNKKELVEKRKARLAMYGYLAKQNNWESRIPNWEAELFRRVHKTNSGTAAPALPSNFNLRRWRNAFTKEGTLKPVSGKEPVRFVPKLPVGPSLKARTWRAKSSNENFETVKSMTKKQLQLLSKVGPINWMALRVANEVPANNMTKYRRYLAARVIQRHLKRHQKKHASRGPSRGPSPRSPRTLARETALGIMGGARRAPGSPNNTRVTWSRNANGKISIHRTLNKLHLNLTQAQRNALNKMSENQAIAYIRNLARAH